MGSRPEGSASKGANRGNSPRPANAHRGATYLGATSRTLNLANLQMAASEYRRGAQGGSGGSRPRRPSGFAANGFGSVKLRQSKEAPRRNLGGRSGTLRGRRGQRTLAFGISHRLFYSRQVLILAGHRLRRLRWS